MEVLKKGERFSETPESTSIPLMTEITVRLVRVSVYSVYPGLDTDTALILAVSVIFNRYSECLTCLTTYNPLTLNGRNIRNRVRVTSL